MAARQLRGDLQAVSDALRAAGAPLSVVRFDSSDVELAFRSGRGALSITVSVPIEFPAAPPLCFTDGAAERVVEAFNEAAGAAGFQRMDAYIVELYRRLCQQFCPGAPVVVAASDASASASAECVPSAAAALPATATLPAAASSSRAPGNSERDDDDDDSDAMESSEGDDDDDDGAAMGDDDDEFYDSLFTENVVSTAEIDEPDAVRQVREKARATKDFTSFGGSVQATDRLMKEFRALMKRDTRPDGFEVQTVDDNLYEWDVKLYGFDPKDQLAKDLAEYKKRFEIDHILLRVKFYSEYPLKPPFVRVVYPMIQEGYVLDGGAICMELLTPMGWSSAYGMDAVLRQIMATMIEGNARIIMQQGTNYEERAALASMKHIVDTHKRDGWYTPPKSKG